MTHGRQILLIMVLYLGACIETDLFLPALPSMMKYFSVDSGQIQKVFSVNFIGICLSSLFIGSISDSIGRRTPLLLSLGTFAFGSLVTTVSDRFSFFLIGRLAQGLGQEGSSL